MSESSRDAVLKTLIETLDALSHQQVLRALIERLQSLARQHQFRISRIAMKHDFPLHLTASYPAEERERLAQQMTEYPFWWVGNAAGEREMLYDSATRVMWDANPEANLFVSLADAKQQVSQLWLGGFDNWKLPAKDALVKFAENRRNPLRRGRDHRLLDVCYWLTVTGKIDLDSGTGYPIDQNGNGRVLACTALRNDLSSADFIEMAFQRGWTLMRSDSADSKDLLATLRETPELQSLYSKIDWLSARLPRLDPAQFTDPNKGLWEFWGWDPDDLREAGARARNPADDLRDWNVAIDFGTSSTVVAYDDNGQYKLLRIGVQDFWNQERPADYENPTILEFIDLAGVLEAWRTEPYRPGVLWDQVRCSHEALARLRHNGTNPCIVSSILVRLKHWALREGEGSRLCLTDQAHGLEHELAPLTLRMPVRGQPLAVGPDDPFDPIELYAWFLGLTINWRGRGLFLRYYMTFPVAYPREVKDKILASFRRGLQRSLPATLFGQPVCGDFAVEERASEPAAYAAAALPLLGIAPTAEGLAYAVFDFGGGTTDFDFGYWRLPDTEEEDAGWEAVLEHFGAGGDPFLGGENLLENLAYRVFRHNLDVCRKHRIAFTRPLDADDFPGSEMFLERTQAALTNTLMLIARLRALLEQGALPTSTGGVEKIDLLNREGGKVAQCEFGIPEEELRVYLEGRIEQGVRNFLAALRKAFAAQPPTRIHVLLAGNASRSRSVARLFGLAPESGKAAGQAAAGSVASAVPVNPSPRRSDGHPLPRGFIPAAAPANPSSTQGTNGEPDSAPPIDPLFTRTRECLATLFGERIPELVAHSPLPIDERDIYRPTAKTGVALGLLKLCPGGVVKVVNRAASDSAGEAPFAFYVGRERFGRFQVGLQQGCPYGQWHELGAPREGVFNLYYTKLPKAHTGDMQVGEAGLYRMRLELSGDLAGHKVYARAVGPDELEVCTAVSGEASEREELDNLRTIRLGSVASSQ